MEETKEQEEVPYYDGLSNLGDDDLKFNKEVMTVDPLKELSDIEYEILALHLTLLSGIRTTLTDNEKATDAELIIQRFEQIVNRGEKTLWTRMADKFGFKNLEQLAGTNLKFRLRSGHFLEAYNE